MYNMALDLEKGDNLCIDLPPNLGNGVDKWHMVWQNRTLLHSR